MDEFTSAKNGRETVNLECDTLLSELQEAKQCITMLADSQPSSRALRHDNAALRTELARARDDAQQAREHANEYRQQLEDMQQTLDDEWWGTGTQDEDEEPE